MISEILPFFQILFWSIAVIIAVLTYRQAKNGLFQPIRTEIFKIQVGQMQEIIAKFQGKGQYELSKEADADKMICYNAVKMYDNYALCKFGLKVELDDRPYNHKNCPISRMSMEYAAKNLMMLDGFKAEGDSSGKKDDHRLTWKDYEYGEISETKQSSAYINDIRRTASNPVLPSGIVDAINEYTEALDYNVDIIGKVLTLAASEMEEKYGTVDDLQKAELHWIQVRYISDCKNLETLAEKIIQQIRTYFEPDNITKGKLSVGKNDDKSYFSRIMAKIHS